jgi:methionine sulfoxide reductase heme-binding subunit
VNVSPNPLWFLDRGAGEVTLLLMSAVMIAGIIRSASPTLTPILTEGLHVNLALLTIFFAGLHIVSALLDPFAALGPVDAFVPFASAYRGAWLGLGVVSGYMFAASVLTSWPTRRLRRAWWVWLHRTMYAAWVIALLHSLGTGSDARNELFQLLNLFAVAGVALAFLGWRVADGMAKSPKLWMPLAVLALATVLAVGVWAADGPLRPGWASSSGTPQNMLHSR